MFNFFHVNKSKYKWRVQDDLHTLPGACTNYSLETSSLPRSDSSAFQDHWPTSLGTPPTITNPARSRDRPHTALSKHIRLVIFLWTLSSPEPLLRLFPVLSIVIFWNFTHSWGSLQLLPPVWNNNDINWHLLTSYYLPGTSLPHLTFTTISAERYYYMKAEGQSHTARKWGGQDP